MRQDLNKSVTLLNALNELAKKDIKKIHDNGGRIIFLNIKSLLDQVKWNISEKSQTNTLDKDAPNEHIMISYNKACKEIGLKIKEKLEASGYRVWMYFNEVHGSNLNVITKAVEKSACLLMCVTEKYRQSINCQLEAQYAFKLNKKIIPLIMQSGYENANGWLSSIISGKPCINFTTANFDECLKKLTNELVDVKTLAPIPLDIPLVSSTSSLSSDEKSSNNSATSNKVQERPSSAEEWQVNHVKEWFAQNNLPINIFDYFKPCNGKILKELYSMKSSSPDLYYQSFKDIKGLKFNALILFSAKLDEVFKK